MRKKSNLGIFTILELLLVIAVIIILMSLLLPSLRKAKNKSQAIHCLGNQKQLIITALNYSDSFDGYFVFANYTDGSCWGRIIKNAGIESSFEIFSCPSEKHKFVDYFKDYHYGLNIKTFGATPVHASYKPQKVSAIISKGSPGLTIAFTDSTPLSSVPTPNSDASHIIMYGALYPLDNATFCYPTNIERHDNRANTVFLDGHASSMSITDLRDGMYWRPLQIGGVLYP